MQSRNKYQHIHVAQENGDDSVMPVLNGHYHHRGEGRRRIIMAILLMACVGVMAGLVLMLSHRASLAKQNAHPITPPSFDVSCEQEVVFPKNIANPVSECTVTLLVMRHCEKDGPLSSDDDVVPSSEAGGVVMPDQHCSWLGFQRAQWLATQFGTRWPPPYKLWALTSHRKGHENYRQVETLSPLAVQSNITIQMFDRDELAPYFWKLLAKAKATLCGKTIVAVWKHSFLDDLALALGCTPGASCPPIWQEEDFDSVWEFQYVYQPANTLLNVTTTKSKGDSGRIRRLKKVKEQMPPGWTLYVTATHQNFDPLSYQWQQQANGNA